MKQAHLIPAAGRKVIDPDTGLELPAEGKKVSLTSYWLRRIRDEDVTIQSERASKSKPAEEK